MKYSKTILVSIIVVVCCLFSGINLAQATSLTELEAKIAKLQTIVAQLKIKIESSQLQHPIGNQIEKCKKVCKSIGSRSEGWYDSCSEKLISRVKCGTVTVQPMFQEI